MFCISRTRESIFVICLILYSVINIVYSSCNYVNWGDVVYPIDSCYMGFYEYRYYNSSSWYLQCVNGSPVETHYKSKECKGNPTNTSTPSVENYNCQGSSNDCTTATFKWDTSDCPNSTYNYHEQYVTDECIPYSDNLTSYMIICDAQNGIKRVSYNGTYCSGGSIGEKTFYENMKIENTSLWECGVSIQCDDGKDDGQDGKDVDDGDATSTYIGVAVVIVVIVIVIILLYLCCRRKRKHKKTEQQQDQNNDVQNVPYSEQFHLQNVQPNQQVITVSEVPSKRVNNIKYSAVPGTEPILHESGTVKYVRYQTVMDFFQKEIQIPYETQCKYLKAFIENGFDTLDSLKTLSNEDLMEIGVDKVGHRKLILSKIHKIQIR